MATANREPMVVVGGRVPLRDFQRLEALAQKRGWVTQKHGRPNVSEALRLAVALGLAAAEREQATLKEVQS